MKEKPFRLFSRAALALLMMLLTSTTAWATITGSGTQQDPYIIHDASDWNTAGQDSKYYYNDGNHVYIELDADIDFNWSTFNRFGQNPQESTPGSCYIHFDGKGHTIQNISMNRGSNNFAAPFGNLATGSTISNLTVVNSKFTADRWVAGITCKNSGTISNCHVESTVTLTANTTSTSEYCGGITAQNGGNTSSGTDIGTITNCTVGAKFVLVNRQNEAHFGGIVGYNYGASPVSGSLCYSTDVTSSLSYFKILIGSSNGSDNVVTNNYYRPVGDYGHGAPEASTTLVRAVSGIPSGVTSAELCVSHGDYGYFAANSTITLTAPAYKAFNNDFSASGTGSSYTLSGNKTIATVTIASADVTINASLRNFTYTVTFKGNGSTSGSMSPQGFEYSVAQNLTDCAFNRTGYTFAGWATSANGNVLYSDGESVSNLVTTDGGTLDLYAKWTANEYTVTLDGQSATTAGTTEVTATYDAAMPAITVPERTGYTFGGYYTATDGGGTKYYNADGTSATAWNIAEATTLYAKWTPITYSVAFDGNGNTGGSMDAQNFTYDAAQNLTANAFTRTGYSFAGWAKSANSDVVYADGENVNNLTTTDGGTVTLYAKWTINEYTISFDTNGGTPATIDAITQDYGTDINAPADPSREGYDFAGWSPALPATMPADNITHTAQWTPITYNITYDLDGGSVAIANPTTYNIETETFTLNNPTLSDPSRPGYNFVGWTGSNGIAPETTITIAQGSMGDKSYTANWSEYQYALTINLNGGAFEPEVTVPTGYNESNEDFEIYDIPSRDGYKFDGWSGTGIDTHTGIINIPTGSTGNRLYTANWTAINYSIHYILNKGTNAEGNINNLDYGYYGYNVESETFTIAPATREGFTFLGWTGWNITTPQTTVTIPKGTWGEMTFTAHWLKNGATVWSEGAGTESDPYIISSTADLDLLATRVNDGEDFYGTYFKLGSDITYTGGSATESNYTAIGNSEIQFMGTFDGDGHTIKGIRIYRSGTDDADNNQGLFGWSGGTIKNVTLADANITGFNYVAGIVGLNYGIIENCHVESDVTIGAVQSSAYGHGGIAGSNFYDTSISHCTSAVTLTPVSGGTCFGGIAGKSVTSATLSHNLVIGATVPQAGDTYAAIACIDDIIPLENGVITGLSSALNLDHNYYANCTIGGEPNATDKGFCYKFEDFGTYEDGRRTTDLNDATKCPDGAVSAVSLANNADNSTQITALNGQTTPVILSGRTLYKDGYWNTLVLPFDVTIASSPLAGNNVVAKVLSTTSKLVNGTLTLNFSNAPATIPAGTPFIIKWDNTGVNLVNPVFTGVTIDNTNRDVNFTGGSFMGTYAPLEITDANRSKVLLLSGKNKLGYAKTDRTIANGKALGTCRAYFYFPGSQTARSFVMNFGEDDTQTTGIVHTEITESTEMAGAIYDLQGRRIEKPKKGLYIVNGKKVLVH